jgi:hypothetical protein
MHDDWRLDRTVSAIRSAAQVSSTPAVADALAAAIAKQQGRERLVARKREQDLAEAARRQEKVAVMSALGVELPELRDTDPGMTLSMRWNSSRLTPAVGLLSIDIVVVTTATSDRGAWVRTIS